MSHVWGQARGVQGSSIRRRVCRGGVAGVTEARACGFLPPVRGSSGLCSGWGVVERARPSLYTRRDGPPGPCAAGRTQIEISCRGDGRLASPAPSEVAQHGT